MMILIIILIHSFHVASIPLSPDSLHCPTRIRARFFRPRVVHPPMSKLTQLLIAIVVTAIGTAIVLALVNMIDLPTSVIRQ